MMLNGILPFNNICIASDIGLRPIEDIKFMPLRKTSTTRLQRYACKRELLFYAYYAVDTLNAVKNLDVFHCLL